MPQAKKKVGDLLVEKGLISSEQLADALKEQKATGVRLGEVLVTRGLISEDQLVDIMSERLSVPRISIKQMVIDPSVVQEIPVEVARRYSLIPVFRIGNALTVAMADPLNVIAIEEIQYQTGKTIKRAIAPAAEIGKAINEYYSVADNLQGIIGKDQEAAEEHQAATSVAAGDESQSPVIRMVDMLISQAVRNGASDIHIEPEEARIRIRNRINGVMHEEAAPGKSLQNELISRIKIAANLDVSEKRVPQDGRFMAVVDGAMIDLRVSTLPTIHGEKIVIRILDRRNLLLNFSQLGFNTKVEDIWQNMIRRPEGLILISGPTSSGKTSTLYATLNEINSVEKNIITVEDPVEYSLPLIIQVQINERSGLTFPVSLRSILRQNPDILMIGEIRDLETAQMAIRSSLTGHLVLSTIHTNDAPSAITRLIDMGIEKYLVSSALQGVLAQRLVRKNCPNCLEPYRPSDVLLARAGLVDLAEDLKFRRGTGCSECKRTGFKGLTGVYELVEVTPRIADMVIKGASLNEIKDEARRRGYVPLFEMGLEKLARGEICLEELLKQTTNIEDGSVAAAARTTVHIHAE